MDCVMLDGEEREDDEEEIEKYRMIWDDVDGIWRCTTCMWEIEADGDNDDHCQYPSDPNDANLPTIQLAPDLPSVEVARPIELQYHHDYEPADSDSSGESVNTETDSGDESFIDDDDEEDLEPALLASNLDQVPPPSSGSATALEKEGSLATPVTALSHTT